MAKICVDCGKEKKSNKGERCKPCSDRINAKLGTAALTGKSWDDSSRKKMSARRKGKTINRPKGIKHAPGWSERCRNWMLGNKNGVGRKVSEKERERTRQMAINNLRRGTRKTSIEKRVEGFLLDTNTEYKYNYPIAGVGVVDFLLSGSTTIIECDGEYWHRSEEQHQTDKKRDLAATQLGYTVVRLPERKINKEFDWCKAQIIAAITRRE